MLTLVDALDTLVVLGNFSEFEKQVVHLGQTLDFNKDVNVSVFETNIRIVGGLLSAHLLITDADIPQLQDFRWKRYDNSMLRLAVDVADRLLEAFDTETDLPFGTVNLKHGVPPEETPIVCTACAGTYALEFGVLSVLTGNPKYELTARLAIRALWSRKSPINLVGNHINSAFVLEAKLFAALRLTTTAATVRGRTETAASGPASTPSLSISSRCVFFSVHPNSLLT